MARIQSNYVLTQLWHPIHLCPQRARQIVHSTSATILSFSLHTLVKYRIQNGRIICSLQVEEVEKSVPLAAFTVLEKKFKWAFREGFTLYTIMHPKSSFTLWESRLPRKLPAPVLLSSLLFKPSPSQRHHIDYKKLGCETIEGVCVGREKEGCVGIWK